MQLRTLIFLAIQLMVVQIETRADGDVTAWFAPSAKKILRDAKPNPDGRQWELSAARNEVEACQLVVSSDRSQARVAVSVSDFRTADGAAIISPKLFKVEYVPNIVGAVAYPDPLPPLKPFELKPNLAQPVWISVKVPKDARPGDYAATVRVEAGGRRLEYPLRLHVWNFALPETPSCTTAFGLDKKNYLALQHGVAANSAKTDELYAKYYEALLDHRISAYTIPVDLMSDAAAKYLNDPRMTSFQIPYPADDAALKAMVDRLVKGGWYSKGFFYPIDEPIKKEAYETIKKINERLHRCASGFRWVVPFFRNPDWDAQVSAFDLMINRVNVWCLATQFFDTFEKARHTLAVRHRLGEPIWWYVCCGPRAPYNNFFVDMSAMSHRLLFWQQKREKVDGLLYWNTAYWNPDETKDPWTDMATVKKIDAKLRGDGSLFYPGKQVGVDGPVSSIRLEVIRDGLEDFDYLTLADALFGAEKTRSYVVKMAPDMKHFEQDPLVLEKTRRELGNLLEKKTATPEKPAPSPK
jgi:hypothetical protein